MLVRIGPVHPPTDWIGSGGGGWIGSGAITDVRAELSPMFWRSVPAGRCKGGAITEVQAQAKCRCRQVHLRQKIRYLACVFLLDVVIRCYPCLLDVRTSHAFPC